MYIVERTISETKTNLSSRKGHLIGIQVQQSSKVDKQSLSRFGTQKSDRSTFRSNRSLEHEIKGKGRTKGFSIGWRLAIVFQKQFIEFFRRKCIGLSLDPKMIFLFFIAKGRIIFQMLVDGIFQELVCTKAFTSLNILDHEIGKAIDVATGLENDFGGQARAFHFQHVFRQDKVLSPSINHCGLRNKFKGGISK